MLIDSPIPNPRVDFTRCSVHSIAAAISSSDANPSSLPSKGSNELSANCTTIAVANEVNGVA